MNQSVPSLELIRAIEQSEIDYMYDRMLAIRGRPGNPEGVEIGQFGNALCLYSRTMHWPSFNTVKGLTSEEIGQIDAILDFYRSFDRTPQFEIVPSRVDRDLLKALSDRGFYQSGFHASLFTEPMEYPFEPSDSIAIRELREDEFDQYAAIHCRGTGLPDNGIPYVSANNRVLYNRPEWKFYMAYVNEQPAAAAVMHMKDGIASLTFAATLPEYRRLGLHRRLLDRRIADAKRNGCTLAVSQCAFLSQSHRNMERIGMKIGFLKTLWTGK
ncbi:GCN5-related N-acetyltransferase [Thermobacillus xylanilyticus]|uniref:GCN5-related N-acetyltransferase n=1 Tax=Thermobacillus xylanilyticus TaxID=76633 RepID=A0ABN7RWB6_THEXY|nr:GNAT family N-acetyltransferase [Thermobacillus xylanilyticus]CAG5084741.1 GCN5-related N-acetyltransferase [Thermobacillus xylanilyticus]